MMVNLIRNLEITLQNMKDAYTSREEVPFWATKLLTPTFMAVAILTTIPPPGPTRVIVGMTAFTSLWLYVLTHWMAGPAFFMDAIFMISITVRWMLMCLTGAPEIDYYQNSKTATKLDTMRLDTSEQASQTRRGANPTSVVYMASYFPLQLLIGFGRDFPITTAGRILLNRYISDMVRKYAFCAFWPAQQASAATIDFGSLPMLHQHLLVAAQLIRDGLMLDSEYRKASLLCVGLYLSTPDRWPGLFGSPADLSGEVVASALGAEKGSLMYRYTKLYVGFLVSGVQHYACPLLIPSLRYGWGMFWQMPAYAAVITAEDLIKHYGKKAGIRDDSFVHGLGYVWTAYWMTLIYALPVGYVSDIGGFAGSQGQVQSAQARAIAAFVIANHASTARSDALDGHERGLPLTGLYIPHSTVNGQDLVMADVRGDDTPLLAGGITADNINSISSVFEPSFEALLAGSPLSKDPTTRDSHSDSCHTGYPTASPSDAWGDLSLFLPDYNISSLSHPEHVVAGIDQLPPLSVDASNTSSENGDCGAKCYTALLQQLLFLRQSLPESSRPSIDVILEVESHERRLLDRVLSCATCLSNRSSVLLMSVITERVIQMLDWIIEEKTLLDTESARSIRRTASSWTQTSQLPPAGNRTDGRPYVCLVPLHVGSTELDEDTKQYFLKQLILMRMKKLAAKVQDVRRTTSTRRGDCIYRAAELVLAESLQRLDYLRGQVQMWE
ncbi:hypothetical protein KXV22_007997 [Aspergillus fumigatus]|uniref:Uncharacterized protein n=2 Tax=Aspergillus fumigatus TaxID=746128 RepID=A0A8H4MIN0_ASPFM|nr:hypothetical protein CNMCM8057_000936 [Aspergillus fumigatus]KAH1363553.1 hypothetical protein KXX14_007378 [Aspergillus fumigatus]KAH1845058.1 hypothetical protein KXX54_009676 [Aspergillus fumigatus]KAH1911155.1 hypothetical protein KXV57_004554 [Aspergillus fumigatus]KAH2877302.1 hypothetical protein KXV31_006330 [Aspergillus fumigatus]